MTPWLLATGDFTETGGMDRANYALAAYLAKHGRPVHLVAHRVEPSLAAEPGVTPHLVPRPFGAHLLGAPLLARAAARHARALGPSARVLMNGGNGAAGVPVWIHYLHAAYEPDAAVSVRTRLSAAAGGPYYLRRERAAVASAPLVLCNSARTAADVQRAYGVPDRRLRVIYYGCDAQTFGPPAPDERHAARAALGIPEGRNAAAFIGALGDRRKGFDVLFDAWQSLAAAGGWDDMDLLVAGVGAEREAWAARARAAGLAGRVRFLGFRSDVATILAAVDVLVHPVRYEAYGLGVHEALCRGVPAIVTATAGVAERFPSSLAGLLLADPPAADALARALRAWRSDPAGWRARVAPLSDELRGRSWDAMAAEIVLAVEGAA